MTEIQHFTPPQSSITVSESLSSHWQKIESFDLSKGNTIINADDFGLNPSVNKAIISLLKNGKIQRTTVMVNIGDSSKEAFNLLTNNGLIDCAGIHLNLADGEPLTNYIKNTDLCTSSCFNGSQGKESYRLWCSPKKLYAVYLELDAQIKEYKKNLGKAPMHADAHGHFHCFLPFLMVVVVLCLKHGIRSLRIPINLYDRKKVNFAKNAYKTFVTTIVKALFKHTDYMGSYTEYRDYYVYGKDKSLEIMVHPTLHNNEIVDTIFENGQIEYIDFEEILRHV